MVYLRCNFFSKPEFCADISLQLVEMVTRDFTSSEDQQAVEDIVKIVLSSMVNVGNHSLRELFSLSSSIMESFTTTVSGYFINFEFFSE